MRFRQLILALLGVVVLAGVTHAAPQEANKEKKGDANDLGAQWWALVTSLPPAVNPFLDETKCGVGQAGPVWFLYSTALPQETIGEPTDVSCTIPADKSIFLTATTVICVRDFDQSKKDLVEQCAQGFDGVTGLRLVIDGQDYTKLIERDRSRRPFTLVVPEENVLGFPAMGAFSAIYDGYSAHLPPLKLGDHSILVEAAIVLDDGTPVAFSSRHLVHIVEREATLPPEVEPD